MNNRRSPIYLITGLILGVALGIVYGWIWTPVEAIETSPQELRSDFKDAYRELIARAYQANNDLGRATRRLALLGDDDPARALAVQAQLTLGEDESAESARALGSLAAALQNPGGIPVSVDGSQQTLSPSPLVSPTRGTQSADLTTPTISAPTQSSTPEESSMAQTPGIPEPTGSTPTPTSTPTPSPTPTATQGPPFVLVDIPLECNPAIDPPLIQVYIFDGAGNPVPGVAILVSWDGGNTNRFVTGLKPEYGLGYADFTMDPSITYSLRLEAGGDPINSITGRLCEDQDEPYWGSWRLNFVQP